MSRWLSSIDCAKFELFLICETNVFIVSKEILYFPLIISIIVLISFSFSLSNRTISSMMLTKTLFKFCIVLFIKSWMLFLRKSKNKFFISSVALTALMIYRMKFKLLTETFFRSNALPNDIANCATSNESSNEIINVLYISM